MKSKATIKELYSKIRQCLFYMIPESWESIYLYASVIQRDNGEETGEMFFYYFPKSIIKRNPINVYQIPNKFNLDENEFIKLTNELYELIKELRRQCKIYEKIDWSNITISIENVEFLAEYDCDELINSIYSNTDRMVIWQYKYLDYPMEKFPKEIRKIIKQYLAEEEHGLHAKKTYGETFYQPHEHNNISYDINRKEDEYIKVDEETKDFTMVNDDIYEVKPKRKFFKKKDNNKMLNEKNEKFKEDEIVVRNQILKY